MSIAYSLTQKQKSYIKAHLIPMLEKEETIEYEGTTYHSGTFLLLLEKILTEKEYNQREKQILEDLHKVREHLKRNPR